MAKKLQSPNDSLLQSTREPSTRLDEIDGSSFRFSKRLLGSSATVGGGSFRSYMIDHVERMHADIESTTRKLELEQRRLHKLDKELAGAETEFGQKRQRYKLFQNQQDDAVQYKVAEVRQLERRVEKAMHDLDRGTWENEQKREEIDQLRKERQILDTVFRQLDRSITHSKKAMDRLKTSMGEEKMVSEEAEQKARAMNKILVRERRQFQKATEAMKESVKKENAIQTVLERLQAPERENQGPMKGKNRRAYMVADEEEAFSEQSMHRRILKLSFLNTCQRRHIKQHTKNIEVFEQAFATIKSSTGISDIEEIVKIFVYVEQCNFSLLTYVNHLNREIESTETRNRDLQAQLKTRQTEENESGKRKEIALSEILSQISRTKAASQDQEKMTEDAAAAVEDCRPLIWKTVKFLKQETPELVNIGYEGEAPPMKVAPPDENEESLNQYLMYIEEVLMQFRMFLSTDSLMHRDKLQPKASPPASGTRRPGDLPSAHIAGDDSDDDPDSTQLWPLSRGELRDRAQAMLQRRRKKQDKTKLAGHEAPGRPEPAEEQAAGATRRDTGPPGPPPPPKEYAASSVASRDSPGETGAGNLTRSPSMSMRQQSDGHIKEGDEEPAGRSQRMEPYRDEMWWRNQGKERKR